jgi:hypothetical protein
MSGNYQNRPLALSRIGMSYQAIGTLLTAGCSFSYSGAFCDGPWLHGFKKFFVARFRAIYTNFWIFPGCIFFGSSQKSEFYWAL